MKRLAVLCAALALFVPLAYGQALPPQVKAEIPFDFYVGDRAMPAGEYMILNNLSSLKQIVHLIKLNDGARSAVAQGSFTEDRNLPGDRIELGFLKYDNDHTFLRVIRSGVTLADLNLPMCRTEREHVTSTYTPVARVAPAKVVILARLR